MKFSRKMWFMITIKVKKKTSSYPLLEKYILEKSQGSSNWHLSAILALSNPKVTFLCGLYFSFEKVLYQFLLSWVKARKKITFK